MRNALSVTAIVCALLLATSCKKEEKPPEPQPEVKPPEPEAKPPEPQPEEKPPEPEAKEDTMKNDAAMCPSAVAGAETKIAVVKGKLVVTVDGKLEGAMTLIKQRGKEHIHQELKEGQQVEHSGKGTGGGAQGLCPTLMPDTEVKVKETKTGIKVEMKPKDKAKLEEIKAGAEKRLADLMHMFRENKAPDSLGHGSGGGKGEGGGLGEGGGKGEAKHKEADDSAKPDEKKPEAKKPDSKKKPAKDDDDSGW